MTSSDAMKRAEEVRPALSCEAAWADRLVDGDRAAGRAIASSKSVPGPGALTLRLAPRVAHLTAVEIDRDLVAALAAAAARRTSRIVAGRLPRRSTSTPLPAAGPLRVAGNLPYNVSSPILFRLLRCAPDAGRISSTRR